MFKTQFSTYSTDVAIEPKMRKMIVMYLRVLGVGKKTHTHNIANNNVKQLFINMDRDNSFIEKIEISFFLNFF